MNIDGQGIVADDPFDRVDTVALRHLDLFVLHLAAGVGDVHGAVDHGGDSGAGASAGHRNRDIRVDLFVVLRPGLGDVDQRIGALVLDHLSSTPFFRGT